MASPVVDVEGINSLISTVQRSRYDGYQVFVPPNAVRGPYPPSVAVSEPPKPRHFHPLPAERGAPSWGGSSATEISIIFDGGDDRSIYSTSTAQSRAGPDPLHHQRPQVPMFALTQLPCEFSRFAGCDETFGLYQTDAWIQHIVDRHLNGILPVHCICWFCSEANFTAEPNNDQGREACYRVRMRHIAGHFHDGRLARERRPDFFFLDHVHDNGLIGEDVFQREKRRGELPKGRGIRINTTPPATREVGDIIVENRRHSRRRETGWANSQSRRL